MQVNVPSASVLPLTSTMVLDAVQPRSVLVSAVGRADSDVSLQPILTAALLCCACRAAECEPAHPAPPAHQGRERAPGRAAQGAAGGAAEAQQQASCFTATSDCLFQSHKIKACAIGTRSISMFGNRRLLQGCQKLSSFVVCACLAPARACKGAAEHACCVHTLERASSDAERGNNDPMGANAVNTGVPLAGACPQLSSNSNRCLAPLRVLLLWSLIRH